MKFLRTIFLAGLLVPALHSQTDWPAYGHDPSGERYSPLAKINVRNVSKLRPAWQYGIDPGGVNLDAANRFLTSTEAVPIMAGGILYAPTVNHTIVALEPETGKEIWKYDLGKAAGAPLRGVTYWQGDGPVPPQILAGTSDGRLIALNAKTGKLVPGFGNEGTVDLRAGVVDKFPGAPYHMASPGMVYRNLIRSRARAG